MKSENVLVSIRLIAKLTDFGTISQVHATGEDDSGKKGRFFGTLLYMPPEAFTPSMDYFRADVFSFGVLMWELLHNKRPDLLAQECPNFRSVLGPKLISLLNEEKRLAIDQEVLSGTTSYHHKMRTILPNSRTE